MLYSGVILKTYILNYNTNQNCQKEKKKDS